MFGKLSVMVWGCISSKGVGAIWILNEIIAKEEYFDILKNELIVTALRNSILLTRLIRINSITNKSYLCKSWLLYNCTKIIGTPAQSPDINPVENLRVHLKEKIEKRSPKNQNELIRFIKGKEKIPSEYDIPKLIQSMRRCLQAVIDDEGGHIKY